MFFLLPFLWGLSVQAGPLQDVCARLLLRPTVDVHRVSPSPFLLSFQRLREFQVGAVPRGLRKKWDLALTEMDEHLREGRALGRLQSHPDGRQILELWQKAVARTDVIEEAYRKMTVIEKKAFQPVLWAIGSALISHSVSWTEEPLPDLDLVRLKSILEAIESFDPDRSKFSFYRVLRRIEGRYSLSEYIHCWTRP